MNEANTPEAAEPQSDNSAAPEPVARQLEPAGSGSARVSTDELDLDQYPTGQLLKLHEDDITPVVEPVVVPYGEISFGLGLLGVIGGLFVAWAFPASIGAIVFGVLARRRSAPHWSGRVGLVFGIAGVVFGGVWLLYYLTLLAI